MRKFEFETIENIARGNKESPRWITSNVNFQTERIESDFTEELHIFKITKVNPKKESHCSIKSTISRSRN